MRGILAVVSSWLKLMASRPSPSQTELPRLPWYGTVIILAGVIVIALVRPLMPHGIVEYVLRLTGRPLSLDLGHGRSLTLTEDRPLTTGCQASALGWSPDATTLVMACPNDIQAWTPDGHEIGRRPVPYGSHYMQVLDDPFRVAYLDTSKDTAVRDRLLTIWNVKTGGLPVLPIQLNAVFDIAVDQDHARAAVTDLLQHRAQLRLLSLDSGDITRTLQIPSPAKSLRWLPGSEELLMGGYDGVLRLANVATGNVRDLTSPYTTSFPGGGSEVGVVGGLVLAPGGRSVAIFSNAGLMSISRTSKTDLAAAKKWAETLGTTVEIRSVDDGRLLDRMPGRDAGISDLAWDPRDRFIAVAGHDALFLWQRQSGAVSVRTYDDPGISHSVSISNDGTRLALTTAKGVRIFRINER